MAPSDCHGFNASIRNNNNNNKLLYTGWYENDENNFVNVDENVAVLRVQFYRQIIQV